VIGVERRDRLARFAAKCLAAVVATLARWILVVDGVGPPRIWRAVIEVRMSMCARVYGHGGAGHRALRAVTAKPGDPVEAAG
jgi:predicted site-specific integrase-resolvase